MFGMADGNCARLSAGTAEAANAAPAPAKAQAALWDEADAVRQRRNLPVPGIGKIHGQLLALLEVFLLQQSQLDQMRFPQPLTRGGTASSAGRRSDFRAKRDFGTGDSRRQEGIFSPTKTPERSFSLRHQKEKRAAPQREGGTLKGRVISAGHPVQTGQSPGSPAGAAAAPPRPGWAGRAWPPSGRP